MYFLDFRDFQIAGASPEPLLTVSGRKVSTRPIAGTRPRGADQAEDAQIAEGLLADEKERAEHLMLLDLGRNDVGRVAKLIWHAIDVYNVIMSRKLASIIAREKPDVISTSNLSCLSVDIWRLARNAGVPIVHTARDYYLMCPTAIMFSHSKPCQRSPAVAS